MVPVEDAAKLAVEALEALDLGIVVCTPELDRIVLANEAARGLLREFGVVDLHAALRIAITGSMQRATPQGATSSVRLVLPSGRRLFVRARRLRDSLLATLRGEVLREEDLSDTLRRRFDLTVRERQVVALVRVGHSNEDVGRELGISVGTVKQYLNRVFKAFDVRSRGELVAFLEQIAREQLAT